MNLQEWDNRIAPFLQHISRHCAGMQVHGSQMKWALENLPARPVWATLAQDELLKLEIMLRELLVATLEAQRRYEDLPVIIEHYTSDSFTHFVDDRDDEQLRYETEAAHAERTGG